MRSNLSYLDRKDVAASTQNVALPASLHLSRPVPRVDLPIFGASNRHAAPSSGVAGKPHSYRVICPELCDEPFFNRLPAMVP